MKIYLVGGAVRDKVLKTSIKDRDWVVTGATSDQLLSIGYTQVNQNCPVFNHPQTNEEYALARTEVKVKSCHDGFTFDTSPNITIEMDLKRRDLTINAMAEDEQGRLIDPYQGINDIQHKVLRHVSPAFVEDPMRLLRISRFMAKYAHLGFQIAPDTMTLMKEMVEKGELATIPTECVWTETEKALAEKSPEAFFEALSQCGALPLFFPHLKMTESVSYALKKSAELTNDPATRFAVLLFAQMENTKDLNTIKQTISNFCQTFHVPKKYRDLSLAIASHYQQAIAARSLPAEKLLRLLMDFNINQYQLFKTDNQFDKLLIACQAIAESKHINDGLVWLKECAIRVKSCRSQELTTSGLSGPALGIKLKEKRLDIIKECAQSKTTENTPVTISITH